MEFLVIAYALLAFMAFVIIFGGFGKIMDDKKKRIEQIGGDQNAEYRELRQSFYERVIKPKADKIKVKLDKRMPRKKRVSHGNEEKKSSVEKQLRLAGMFIDIGDYNFRKYTFMVVVIALGLVVALIFHPGATYTLFIILGSAVLSVIGPTYYVKSRVSSHQLGIKRQLPDAMDMLSVCIEAGLSFDAALLKVSEKLKGPFIDELMIVYREIQMGRTRKESLMNLSDATNIDELKTFLSALVQAEQLGIPINNIMKAQSEQLRTTRRQEAKEKGMKATIKMLVPMLIFIFPVIFIIVIGPTVINIMGEFGN